MQLRIKQDVVQADRKHGGYNTDYQAKLAKLAGKLVDVETDYLFADQYNIKQENLRVFDYHVAEVIEDARSGRQRCQWCGKHSVIAAACPHCGKAEYLTAFTPFQFVPSDPGPSEYDIRAQSFLERHGLTFKAVFVSSACPEWCDGEEHTHGDKYRVTIRRAGARSSFTSDFWNSYADKERGEIPTPYDLLSCLTKADPGTFEDMCSAYGWDTDSRKALKQYRAVVREWSKVRNFFTPEEIEELYAIE